MKLRVNNSKFNIKMKRIAIVITAVLISTSAAYSQETAMNNPNKDTLAGKSPKNHAQHRFHLYYGMGYANDIYSRMDNDFIHNGFSCSQFMEARYAWFFARKWGLSFGAGVSHFFAKGTLNIDGMIPDYNDPDFGIGRYYDLHYKTDNLVERQQIWALKTPLQFHFEHRKGRRPGISISLGARGYFPIILTQSTFPQDKGYLTTSGYEEFTNTWYTDPPHFGKRETRLTPSAVKLRPSVDITADLGMIFRLCCYADFYLGVYGSYGFLNILPEDADKKNFITPEQGNLYTVNSLLGSNILSDYNKYIDDNKLDWKKADEEWKRWQVGVKVGFHIKPQDKCKDKKNRKRTRHREYAVANASDRSDVGNRGIRDTIYVYNVTPSIYAGGDNLTQSERENVYKLVNSLSNAKILFDLDSDIPKIDNTNFIVETSNILKVEQSLHLIIEGYTCDLGTEDHNRNLATRRAEAIRNLFVQQGTDPSQIETAAYTIKDPESQLNIQNQKREEHRAVIFRIYKKR